MRAKLEIILAKSTGSRSWESSTTLETSCGNVTGSVATKDEDSEGLEPRLANDEIASDTSNAESVDGSKHRKESGATEFKSGIDFGENTRGAGRRNIRLNPDMM